MLILSLDLCFRIVISSWNNTKPRKIEMTLQKKMVITALAIAAILMVAGVLALTSQRTIPSSGTITGINLGVFQDSGLTTPYDASHPIVWGTLTPGTSTIVPIWLNNTGTTSMTLNLSNNTWVPSDANTYLTLTWDKEGSTLNANTIVAANLNLTVSSSFTTGTPFSVNVVITGTH
jgi:hypothetical protein